MGASQVAQRKEYICNARAAGDSVQSLGLEDPLKEEPVPVAACSSTLAWKTSWTEEPSGLQSMGLQRVGHDWETDHIGSRYEQLFFKQLQNLRRLPTCPALSRAPRLPMILPSLGNMHSYHFHPLSQIPPFTSLFQRQSLYIRKGWNMTESALLYQCPN